MGRSRYPRSWAWPNDAKIAISVNLAFEWFLWGSQVLHSTGNANSKRDMFAMSYGEYAVKSGGPRILEMLDDLGLHGSMSTNGLAAEMHPQLVKQFVDEGHEIVGHGWANDEPRRTEPAEELEESRCTAAPAASGGTSRSVDEPRQCRLR